MRAGQILFYDGHCGSCHRLIRLLLRSKARERFLFYALHEYPELFTGRTDTHGEKIQGDSVVLIRRGIMLQRSSAILGILSEMGFPWSILGILGQVIPRSIRDAAYNLFAKHRFRIFGHASPDSICDLMPPEVKRLFPSQSPEL